MSETKTPVSLNCILPIGENGSVLLPERFGIRLAPSALKIEILQRSLGQQLVTSAASQGISICDSIIYHIRQNTIIILNNYYEIIDIILAITPIFPLCKK